MVASYLADRPALLLSCCALVILSDSKVIIGAINGDTKYSSEPELLAFVLLQLSRVAAIIPYTVQWTPGHCGTVGNDRADALAGQASAANSPAGPANYRALLPSADPGSLRRTSSFFLPAAS